MTLADTQAPGDGSDDIELALVVLRRLELQDQQIEELRATTRRLEAELGPMRRLASAIRVGCDHVADAAEAVSSDEPPRA